MSKRNETAQSAPVITEEQYAAEERLLQGVPRVNIGALFMPPIWGAAHGMWATIIFYPLWIVADTCFVNAIAFHTPVAIALGILVFAMLTAGTVAFSVVSQPFALHRALSRGVSKETYLKRQKIWAVASVVVGLIAIALATYYNLFMNPKLAGLLGQGILPRSTRQARLWDCLPRAPCGCGVRGIALHWGPSCHWHVRQLSHPA